MPGGSRAFHDASYDLYGDGRTLCVGGVAAIQSVAFGQAAELNGIDIGGRLHLSNAVRIRKCRVLKLAVLEQSDRDAFHAGLVLIQDRNGIGDLLRGVVGTGFFGVPRVFGVPRILRSGRACRNAKADKDEHDSDQ